LHIVKGEKCREKERWREGGYKSVDIRERERSDWRGRKIKKPKTTRKGGSLGRKRILLFQPIQKLYNKISFSLPPD